MTTALAWICGYLFVGLMIAAHYGRHNKTLVVHGEVATPAGTGEAIFFGFTWPLALVITFCCAEHK